MNIANVIASGTEAELIDLIDRHDTEEFINSAKNYHYFFSGKRRHNYFQNLKKSLEIDKIINSRSAWQIQFAIDSEFNGTRSALKRIRTLALSTENDWATFVYASNSLKVGDFSEAIKAISCGLSNNQSDTKYLKLLFEQEFFKGNVEFYKEKNVLNNFSNISPEIAIKLAFITHQFTEAQDIFSKVDFPSNYLIGINARAGHAERIRNNPIPRLNIKAYVSGSNPNSPRLQRLAYAANETQQDFEICGNIDGKQLPQSILARLWQDIETISHPEKSTGSMLSHMRIWERITHSDHIGGVVMEDDCMLIYSPKIAIEPLIESGQDLIFLNDRIASNDTTTSYDAAIYNFSREIYKGKKRTIGADCYYMSKRFATHILEYIRENGFPCPSDLFLLEHETPPEWSPPLSVDPAPGEHVDEQYFS